MGGFLGVGGSSAKTDRATQLSAQSGLWNTYNQSLGIGTTGAATGTADLSTAKTGLGTASQYWQNLLTAGRTQTTQTSAPAVNAAIAQGDTTRKTEGAFGTGRTGGAVAANREAGTATGSGIDNIINQNLVGGRTAGAQGLTQVAGEQATIGTNEMSQALQALGLSEDAVKSIMSNATASRPISQEINQQTQEQIGQLVGSLMSGNLTGAISGVGA